MYKIVYSMLFLIIGIKGYCIEIEVNYTLLNGTRGSITIPNDIVEINAFKGDMNFVRSNGEIINLRTISPMTEIIGIENLPILNRMELSMQLNTDELVFLRSISLEYLFIDFITLENMNFLSNFPNLKYLGLQSITYNSNIMDLTNTQIIYFIVSYIRSTETIELLRNYNLNEFIVFFSDIILNENQNIKIINNYNDFINEPQHLRLFMW